VLVYTGIKLVNVPVIRDLARYGRDQIPICAATMLLIVFTDLLTGVIAGLALSAIGLFHQLTSFETCLADVSVDERANTWRLNLRGAALFLRLPKLAWALQKFPPQAHAVIEAGELDVIDHACLDCLKTWEKQHLAGGGTVEIDWREIEAKGAWIKRFRQD